MAKNTTEKENKLPATTANTAVATMDMSMFAEDAGAGMEGATAESFAIPFLSVLQKGSPQVDEASGVAIEGAKAVMLFENVTGKMFDGKGQAYISNGAFQWTKGNWKFVAELPSDAVAYSNFLKTVRD